MTAACPHGQETEPPTATSVSLALDAAHERIVSANQRMTTPRRRVLELLLKSGRPVKAYDLVAAYHAAGRVATPATIYRALEFLGKLGLVHRLSSSKCYVACTLGMAAHPAAFLICDCCGLCREIAAPEPASLSGAANRLGYSVDRITIEAAGRCSACCVVGGE
ncbi:Fur family transcriptional regulator [Brevundimonas sp.]|uniref:Fur family transcriptional regulator n=1 Tax=Brevundimonas sp. TaxID=1871086 RepID=UPI003BAB7C37